MKGHKNKVSKPEVKISRIQLNTTAVDSKKNYNNIIIIECYTQAVLYSKGRVSCINECISQCHRHYIPSLEP